MNRDRRKVFSSSPQRFMTLYIGIRCGSNYYTGREQEIVSLLLFAICKRPCAMRKFFAKKKLHMYYSVSDTHYRSCLMTTFSLFDIAGPVMVGPSSSHTAGAAKIGQFARAIFDSTPKKVTFYLHGSFGEVYKGHATDRALLGGVMKMPPNDARIKDAFDIAEKAGIAFKFEPRNLGAGLHPNTVRVILENDDGKMSVLASSIGGGNVEINKINDFDIHLTGNSAEQNFTLVVENDNMPGMLAKTTGFLGEKGIRIVNMQSSYLAGENKVLSVLSLEKALALDEILELEKEEGIIFVRSLKKLTP